MVLTRALPGTCGGSARSCSSPSRDGKVIGSELLGLGVASVRSSGLRQAKRSSNLTNNRSTAVIEGNIDIGIDLIRGGRLSRLLPIGECEADLLHELCDSSFSVRWPCARFELGQLFFLGPFHLRGEAAQLGPRSCRIRLNPRLHGVSMPHRIEIVCLGFALRRGVARQYKQRGRYSRNQPHNADDALDAKVDNHSENGTDAEPEPPSRLSRPGPDGQPRRQALPEMV